MSLEIKRLHLAKLDPPGGGEDQWPVHGFVITHPGGAVLVDTGVGGPQDVLNDWRVVNVEVADALAKLDMSPADISLVINTHLHFDHCGQNAVFKHAPFYGQRAELDRVRALVVGEPVAGERDDVVRARARFVSERHERLGALPPVRMGDRDDGALQRFDGGRSWYTALGHTEASYLEPEFLRHILGGIEVAAGAATSKACGRKGWHGTNPKNKDGNLEDNNNGQGNDKRR